MSDIIFDQRVNLRTNDFDTHDQLKTRAVLELFQDIAGLHANKIGIGFKDSYDKGYYWVLVRNVIDIFKNPVPLTDAILITWPHEKGRADCNREYLLKDLDGNVIARGLSKWVIIDINTRRLCRTDKVTYGEGEIIKDNYYEDVQKVVIPNEGFMLAGTHKVSKNDLDHNCHMNNTRYADLVFDYLDEDYFIKNMTIEYHHELKLGDILNIYILKSENEIYFKGELETGEKIFSVIIKR